MVWSAKSKLNNIEVLISKALINSVISHGEFVLTSNEWKEFKESKIQKPNQFYRRF